MADSLYYPFLWTGVGEDIFSLTFRRDHIHQNSVRENQAIATVKAMLGMGQYIRAITPHKSLGSSTEHALQRKCPAENTQILTQIPAFQIVFYQALNPPSIGGWGWTIFVFSRSESNYSIVSPA